MVIMNKDVQQDVMNYIVMKKVKKSMLFYWYCESLNAWLIILHGKETL